MIPKCNCVLSITCLFDNCIWNFNFNYFYHESSGVNVPDVNIIVLGEYFKISLNVRLGVRHIKLS